MSVQRMKVIGCPTNTLAYSNRAVISINDPLAAYKHIEIINGSNKSFIFTLLPWTDPSSEKGCLGFNMPMRKWAMLSTNESIQARPFEFDLKKQSIAKITLYIEYMQKTVAADTLNSDELAREFSQQFTGQAFTDGQIIVFNFPDKKLLKLTVKEMEALNPNFEGGSDTASQKITLGCTFPNTQVFFEKSPDSCIQLVGNAKGHVARPALINPNWNFVEMGIGGLDNEFSTIFRRAFASRVFPPDLIDELGFKHVRGMLLYGPPGTGKTLIARKIGQMLNAREPKIVNGPQILDKYVGESEANVRKLFEDAEEEQKKMGINSALHVIIFDEIDAICKARGSVAGSAGVHDTVVNQLLSKIDGVDSLNNILVIGMTNRRDMIDEALLRPGRMEVQLEISLPDEHGRLQILNIHTAKLRQRNMLAADVDLVEIAARTKNFSGAEIEGLIRAAQTSAMNRLIKAGSKAEIDPKTIEKLLVTRQDILYALEYDIKPAFGTSNETIERLFSRGIILWSPLVNELLEDGRLFMNQLKSPTNTEGVVSILLEGAPNSGKSALAARLAIDSDFPFIRLCTPEDMISFTETGKGAAIKKIFDDAYKSPLSVVIVDNIESLLDYVPIGPRFSNHVLQILKLLLKKEPPPGRRLMIVCTTSCRQVLEDFNLSSSFTSVLHVPNLTTADNLAAVLLESALDNGTNSGCFTQSDIYEIVRLIQGRRLSIGIKKLLAHINHAHEMDSSVRLRKFIMKLEEEGAIYLQ